MVVHIKNVVFEAFMCVIHGYITWILCKILRKKLTQYLNVTSIGGDTKYEYIHVQSVVHYNKNNTFFHKIRINK